MIMCPACGKGAFKVIHTDPRSSRDRVYRLRKCSVCGYREETPELIQGPSRQDRAHYVAQAALHGNTR